MNRSNKSQRKSKVPEIATVYNDCQITKEIMLPITAIGQNLLSTLESTISEMVCGKCIVDGYVKPGSITIITYSSGTLKHTNVLFNVVFNCKVCFPVAGMKLRCIIKSITKAGILANSAESYETDTPSPFRLYVARDHAFTNEIFNTMNVGQEFVAKVIDQRFELNDECIYIIAEMERQKIRDQSRDAFVPSIKY
jgi:hypothetical protein